MYLFVRLALLDDQHSRIRADPGTNSSWGYLARMDCDASDQGEHKVADCGDDKPFLGALALHTVGNYIKQTSKAKPAHKEGGDNHTADPEIVK